MSPRPALFAAALVSGILVGILPVLVMAIGLAFWLTAAGDLKKTRDPRSQRRPRLAPSG